MDKSYKKILIIRFSSIGDIIITTPILRSMREKFPNATIDYLTKADFAQLLEHNPDVDSVLSYDKSKLSAKSLKENLKSQKYDLVIDLHNSLRSRYLRFNLASDILVYSKPYFRRWLLVRFGINLLKKAEGIYLRYYEGCRKLNLKEYREYFVHFTPEHSKSVSSYILEKKPILISLSAAHFTKKWALEKFAEVISSLQDENLIVLGGEKEKGDVQELKGLLPKESKFLDLCGKLDLLQTAALMKESKLLLCHDSGLLHLAQSQDLPCVAIFGCTTKELGFFPINGNSEVVQVDLPCRPCTTMGLDRCPKKHFACMERIDAQTVLAKMRERL